MYMSVNSTILFHPSRLKTQIEIIFKHFSLVIFQFKSTIERGVKGRRGFKGQFWKKSFNVLKLKKYLSDKFLPIIQRSVMQYSCTVYVQNFLKPFDIHINKQIVNQFLSPKFISSQNFLCLKKTISGSIESMVALMT